LRNPQVKKPEKAQVAAIPFQSPVEKTNCTEIEESNQTATHTIWKFTMGNFFV
jgi:hypothetical protein